MENPVGAVLSLIGIISIPFLLLFVFLYLVVRVIRWAWTGK